MSKENPVPVVMLTVSEFGECDKWFNLKNDVNNDVLCIWTYRGMLEDMFDYFSRVIATKHQVDLILPKPAIKYTVRTENDLRDLCNLFEMLFG